MRAQAYTHTHPVYQCVSACVCWLCLLNCNKLIVIKHRLYILECVIGLFMLQFSPEKIVENSTSSHSYFHWRFHKWHCE